MHTKLARVSVSLLLTVGLLAGTALAQDEIKKEDPDNPIVVMKTSLGDIYLELFIKDAPKTVKNFIDLAEGTKEFTDPKTNEKVKRPYFDGLKFHRVLKDFMIQGGCPLGTGGGSPGYRFEDEINAKALGLDKIKALDPKTGKPHRWSGIRSRDQFQKAIFLPVSKKLGIKTEKEYNARIKEFQKLAGKITIKEALENLGYKFNDKLKSHKLLKGVIAMANSGPNTNGSQFFINHVDTPHLIGKHTVFGKVVRGWDVVDKIARVEVGAGGKPKEDVKIISIRKYSGK